MKELLKGLPNLLDLQDLKGMMGTHQGISQAVNQLLRTLQTGPIADHQKGLTVNLPSLTEGLFMRVKMEEEGI